MSKAVVWHKHYWPPQIGWDDERRDDPQGRWRFDAVEYDDGTFAVYDVFNDEFTPAVSRKSAVWYASNRAKQSFTDES